MCSSRMRLRKFQGEVRVTRAERSWLDRTTELSFLLKKQPKVESKLLLSSGEVYKAIICQVRKKL
jgi:hypothetical protein